jgi:hypothetical protein
MSPITCSPVTVTHEGRVTVAEAHVGLMLLGSIVTQPSVLAAEPEHVSRSAVIDAKNKIHAICCQSATAHSNTSNKLCPMPISRSRRISPNQAYLSQSVWSTLCDIASRLTKECKRLSESKLVKRLWDQKWLVRRPTHQTHHHVSERVKIAARLWNQKGVVSKARASTHHHQSLLRSQSPAG